MNKKNINWIKVISITLIVVTLVMSFVPVNPWSTPAPPEYEVEPTYRFFSYAKNVFGLVSAGSSGAWAIFEVISALLFYIGSLVSLVFVIINKKLQFKITMLFCVMFLIPTSFPALTSTYYVIGAISVYLLIFLINYINDKYPLTEFLAYKEKKKENKAVGVGLKNRRIELQMTQQELADKAFISRSLISKMESGKTPVNKDNLERIAMALEVDVGYFKKQPPSGGNKKGD